MIKNCEHCGMKTHTQDEIHGKGKRVFNEHKTKTHAVRRCTVCGKEETQPLQSTNKV